MNSRTRVMKALNHEEPDRIPLDLGSTTVTTITASAYNNLKKHLAIQEKSLIVDKVQQIVSPSERVLRMLGIDTRSIWPKLPTCRREKNFQDGLYEDEWGIVRKLAAGGYYYDVVSCPLADADVAGLKSYDWPDPFDPGRIDGVEEARELWEEGKYALAPGGGYVLAPVHNIQPDVKPENLWTMYDTARGYKYSGN